jgi:hypothetical protein
MAYDLQLLLKFQAQIQRDLAQRTSPFFFGCATYELGEIRLYLRELFQSTKNKKLNPVTLEQTPLFNLRRQRR